MAKPNPHYVALDGLSNVPPIPKEAKTIKSTLTHLGWLKALSKKIDLLKFN